MDYSLPAVFGAGLLTFASPCVLPLAPVYLSLLGGTSVGDLKAGRAPRGRLVAAGSAFALGLSSVFVALGMAASVAGRLVAAHRTSLMVVGGVVTALFALRFLGVLRANFVESERRPLLDRLGARAGLLGAFAFGVAFGVGWTPCIGPVLGAVLTYTAAQGASPARGALMLGVYAAGLSLPLVAAAAAAPWVLARLAGLRSSLPTLERLTGVALLAVSAWMLAGPVSSVFARPAVASATAPCAAEGDGVTCAAPQGAGSAGGVATALRGPGVVEFVSPRCTVCSRMRPVVEGVERACGVHVQRVDVADPAGQAAAQRHGIVGVPTFVRVDATGEAVERWVGAQPEATLRDAVERAAGMNCAGPPS